MFYDNFCAICKRNGLKPTNVVKELGLSSGNMTNWKNGRMPKTSVLNKLADYFNISIDELLGNEKTLTDEDQEMQEYLDFLKYRPEGKMLFSVAKGCTKEEIEQAVKIIDALRKTDDE